MTGRIVLVGGGVRSGKSAFALARAEALGVRRAFVATGEPRDDEMRERIARHRAERAGRFHTVEAPLDPGAALAALDAEVAVVDCLTLWLSNLLVRDEPSARILDAVDRLIAVLAAGRVHVVLVSNEVGMGVVPASPLGRAFRDLAGITHQRIARIADEIHLATLGVVVRLHPAPIELSRPGGPDVAAR